MMPSTTNGPIRIGLLGASKIAPLAVLSPAKKVSGFTVNAIAARSLSSAAKYAAKHEIPDAIEGYRALIDRADIDLVYNALPPSAHAQWSIAALDAGKHVLCEKPFALNSHEAAKMVDAAERNGRHLIEAFHYRFHPLLGKIEHLKEEIGELQNAQIKFTLPSLYNPKSFRFRPEHGGGALMDLGCYCIHFLRTIIGQVPSVVSAKAERFSDQVDRTMDFLLSFPSGTDARVTCSLHWLNLPRANAKLIGSKGTLKIRNFVHPWMFHKIWLDTHQRKWKGKVEAGQTNFYYQLKHVRDVLTGKVEKLTGGQDSIATMQVIDQVYAASGFEPR